MNKEKERKRERERERERKEGSVFCAVTTYIRWSRISSSSSSISIASSDVIGSI